MFAVLVCFRFKQEGKKTVITYGYSDNSDKVLINCTYCGELLTMWTQKCLSDYNHSPFLYNVHCTVYNVQCTMYSVQLNYILFIQIANSICLNSGRVVLPSKVNYPVSCNPIKDIMVSFDGTWIKRGYKYIEYYNY